MKTFNFITLFPNMISSYLSEGVLSQAIRKNLLQYRAVNPRDFSEDVHRTVDDTPYGGGDGMLMLVKPLARAVESLSDAGKVVCLSAHGKTWDNKMAESWADSSQPVTFICGRYAGIDQRFINEYVDEEISLGDFIVSGGELPALMIADSVARFIPGVLGNKKSAKEESFQNNGLLECPQFTKPSESLGVLVPEVLRSGHHKKIQEFQLMLSVFITAQRRPDLISAFKISNEQVQAAEDFVGNLTEPERKALGI